MKQIINIGLIVGLMATSALTAKVKFGTNGKVKNLKDINKGKKGCKIKDIKNGKMCKDESVKIYKEDNTTIFGLGGR